MNNRKIKKYRLLLILFGLWFFSSGNVSANNLTSRLLVPVYLTPSVYIGYDNNMFRMSENEMDEITMGSFLLGDAATFDSEIIRPSLTISYSPVLFSNNETNFLFTFARAQFQHSKNKSYSSFSIKGEYHYGDYKWIKLKYSLQPSLHLRIYRDMDAVENELNSCDFANETVYLYLSHPILNKLWGSIYLRRVNQFYNQSFTEFDTEINSVKYDLYTKPWKKMKFSGWFETGEGDNTTFGSGYISTQFDRSYQFNRFGGKWELELGGLIKSVKISIDVNDRMYKTEEENDPLHSGRSHRDTKYSMWISRDINESIETEYYFRYRVRDIFSDYEWVEQLKSFHKFETGISISFNTYLDLFY